MSAAMIEHRGIVQRVEGGKAIVAMENGGCSSCGQGGSCGIGKMASGRPATLLTLPVSGDIKAGDVVTIGLRQSSLTVSALLGYFFPVFAMLLGAWFGSLLEGSDGGSRVRVPAKEDFNRDVCRLRGGKNEHVVVAEIDVLKLRAFQSRATRWPDKSDPYKPVPEAFLISHFRACVPE